jgi:hypothetical protein
LSLLEPVDDVGRGLAGIGHAGYDFGTIFVLTLFSHAQPMKKLLYLLQPFYFMAAAANGTEDPEQPERKIEIFQLVTSKAG